MRIRRRPDLDIGAGRFGADPPRALRLLPATIDWELFAQGETGAIVLIGVRNALDLDEVEEAIAEIGYQEPSEAGGVWIGGPDLSATLGTVSQELAFLTASIR